MKSILKLKSLLLSVLIMSCIVFSNVKADINDIVFKGVKEISSDITEDNKTYNSKESNVNTILVTNGNSNLKNIIVKKSGKAIYETASNGTNSAILVKDGILNIVNGSIKTDGEFANAILAYDKGVINLENINIDTVNNNSCGIETIGGVLTANNVVVKTKGMLSPAIKTEIGGNLTINNGSFETNGTDSPVIYANADVTINDATLKSTSTESITIDGASVILNNTKLISNNTLNNKESYKNIYLYKSTNGIASFQAKNSKITIKKGDTIFITDTDAQITLENNEIVNNSGVFMRIQNNSIAGSNVNLNMNKQSISGDIVSGSNSNINITMNSSLYKGMINIDQENANISLNISKDSVVFLTGDSYINSLNNEDKTNSNIYLNGNNLFVNGEKIEANNGVYNEFAKDIAKSINKKPNNKHIYLLFLSFIAVMIIILLIILKIKEKKDA